MDRTGATIYNLNGSGDERRGSFVNQFRDVGLRLRPSEASYLNHVVKVNDVTAFTEVVGRTDIDVGQVVSQFAPLLSLLSEFSASVNFLVFNVNYVNSQAANPRTGNSISLTTFNGLDVAGGVGLARFLCIVSVLMNPTSVCYGDAVGRLFFHAPVFAPTNLFVHDHGGLMAAFAAAGMFVLPRTAGVLQVVREFLETMFARIKLSLQVTDEELDTLIGHSLSTVYEVHSVRVDGAAAFNNFFGVGRPRNGPSEAVKAYLAFLMRDFTPAVTSLVPRPIDLSYSFQQSMLMMIDAGIRTNMDKLRPSAFKPAAGVSSLNAAAVARHVVVHQGYLLHRGSTLLNSFPSFKDKGFSVSVTGFQAVTVVITTQHFVQRFKLLNFFCHFLRGGYTMMFPNALAVAGRYGPRATGIVKPAPLRPGDIFYNPGYNPAFYLDLWQRQGASTLTIFFTKNVMDISQDFRHEPVMEIENSEKYKDFRREFVQYVSNLFTAKAIDASEMTPDTHADPFRTGTTTKPTNSGSHAHGKGSSKDESESQ